ncbi:MAG: MFS transporter [Desulfobacterium sp.]|nr:MFS transporter [Desulfobacterium sp.]
MKQINLNRKLILIIIGVILASQLVYLYINVQSFKTFYLKAVQSNINTVGSSLKANLDDILQKGISIDKFMGLKSFLQGILNDTPELASITINDLTGQPLYYCDPNTFFLPSTISLKFGELLNRTQRPKYMIHFQLIGKDNEAHGELTLGINKKQITKQIRAIALDTGTIIVVSILAILDFLFFIIAIIITIPAKKACLEIEKATTDNILNPCIPPTNIDFLDALIKQFHLFGDQFTHQWQGAVARSQNLVHGKDIRKTNSTTVKQAAMALVAIQNYFKTGNTDCSSSVSIPSPSLIRPAIFLFVFSEALSISFLPLFAKEIYHPFLNLPEAVALGLPISSFMLFTAISLPFGGHLAEKMGHPKAFVLGASISTIGLLLTGMANHILWLILFRAIVGFGFGTVFMTTQMYIVDQTTAENRAEGMAIFLSAFYGGTLCGAAIGGMVVERVGFRILFFIGAVCAMGSTLFLLFINQNQAKHPPDQQKSLEQKKIPSTLPSLRDIITLFSNRNFTFLVLFQSIPNKICLIGFVYYLAPIYFKELGISQSDTGRYIMCYSLIMILFSQSVSRWSDKFSNPKKLIFWGGLLSGAALIPCFFFHGPRWVFLGIVVLGFSHTLSVSNQAKLASQLKALQFVGLGPGLGIYRQSERIGNVLAPILAGTLITTMEYGSALAIIGIYTSLSSILFLVTFRDLQEQ